MISQMKTSEKQHRIVLNIHLARGDLILILLQPSCYNEIIDWTLLGHLPEDVFMLAFVDKF